MQLPSSFSFIFLVSAQVVHPYSSMDMCVYIYIYICVCVCVCVCVISPLVGFLWSQDIAHLFICCMIRFVYIYIKYIYIYMCVCVCVCVCVWVSVVLAEMLGKLIYTCNLLLFNRLMFWFSGRHISEFWVFFFSYRELLFSYLEFKKLTLEIAWRNFLYNEIHHLKT